MNQLNKGAQAKSVHKVFRELHSKIYMLLPLSAFKLIYTHYMNPACPPSVCTRLGNIITMTYVYHVWTSCFLATFCFNLTAHFLLGKWLLVWQALLAIQLICRTTQSLLCKSIIDGHVCSHVNFFFFFKLLMTTTDACLWLVELENTRALLNKWKDRCRSRLKEAVFICVMDPSVVTQ